MLVKYLVGAKTFGRGWGISEASIILMNIFNLRLH